MISANRGEWAEIYAFVKLICDGFIFGADQNANVNSGLVYKINEVFRNGVTYRKNEDKIEIYHDGKLQKSVDWSLINEKKNEFLNEIKNERGRSFNSNSGQFLLEELLQPSIKSNDRYKGDIQIRLCDDRMKSSPLLTFSIKSYLGGAPTLWNASHATKIRYQVNGLTSFDRLILDDCRDYSSVKGYIKKHENISLTYDDYLDSRCKANFLYVDSLFPVVMSEALKQYYLSQESGSAEIIEKTEQLNPCHFPEGKYYFKKYIDFLVASALGMFPAIPWDGTEKMNGGYIIVKQTGDIVCFLINDRELFRTYLLNHTKFDTPSSVKYMLVTEKNPDGRIYYENNVGYMNLNYQIRFKDEQ